MSAPESGEKMLRAKSKAARFIEQHERETAEMTGEIWNSDVAIALEALRSTKAAFTASGIPTDDEIKEHLVWTHRFSTCRAHRAGEGFRIRRCSVKSTKIWGI